MAEPRSAPRASLGGGGDVRGHLGENVSAESLSESAGDDESVSVAAVLVLPSGGATAAAAAAEVVLQQREAPTTLRDNEVLLSVRACALGALDRALLERPHHSALTLLENAGLLPLQHSSQVIGFEVAGVVQRLGPEAKQLCKGDRVAAFLPVDGDGGCATLAVVREHNLIPLPAELSFERACASLHGGVRAYSALHYAMRITEGETLLVFNALAPDSLVAIQLAKHRGVHVIATCSNSRQKDLLASMLPAIDRIVDTSSEDLVDSVLQATNDLGVDYILEDEYSCISYTKHDMIHCLAPFGTWVTSSELQLDPPDSVLLKLKSATISFMWSQTWVLSSAQQGRFMHILHTVLDKVASREIQSVIAHTFTLDQLDQALTALRDPATVGRVIVTPRT